jgi:CheY-like chemotaxis protein
MEQVLLNLAVNARDAMPDGGRIVIETKNVTLCPGDPLPAAELAPGHYVVVSVTDTGDGMPGEVLEHLFEPFFTTKEMGKGTGLGLSMVYGIVRQSGGAIGVESAVAEGSTFRIYMPATEALATESLKPAVELAAGTGNESILVVEDNDAVRGFVAQILRDSGYRVTDAATPLSALAMLAAGGPTFDLLLTDIVLPEMDGYELARQAAAARPALRLLYMSGYADNPKLREDALRKGIDLLEKPFGAATLMSKVREVLDRRLGVA